jgi:hypothetical protein
VGFETTTPVFERKKTVLAFDRSATEIGGVSSCSIELRESAVEGD